MLTRFVQALMSADADAVCGAPYGVPSPDRTNSRKGYRHRDFDTRAGTLDIAIPKLRSGSYFPDWLLERRRRAERALTTVVATCYLLGVSTRRMEKLVETLGITRLSKSQVSVMAAELDEQVHQFRTRPLDQGPYTFVAALPHPLRRQPHVGDPESVLAVGEDAAALGLRPARQRRRPSTVRPGPGRPGRQTPPRSSTTSNKPAPTCSRSPRSPRKSGDKSGPTTPKND
nr:transposase [Kribbella qitaiheensis]